MCKRHPLPPPIHGHRLHLLHGQTDVGLWNEWLYITTNLLVLRPLNQAGFHKDGCQGFGDWYSFKKLTRPGVTVEVSEGGLTGSGFTVEPGMLKRTMEEPEKALSSLTPYGKFCLWDRCAVRERPLTFIRLLCVCSKTYIKFYGKYTQNLPTNHSQVHSSVTLDTFTLLCDRHPPSISRACLCLIFPK